ncbi:GNAT family N-acetyltransferase [Streptomyces sp. ISL-98]|uniref:GNAT family N-acetyltransferase n=1 Tax=Streptomyces sp. ISL-98 TaxID=2819192 RepID=UPI001BE8B44F|nr:GNAT family N-acetyltransferase [Streptomyces sp. ISL-98]MBT2509910.1 GNAT family N-acetyltransferase [Streptomyces sp. ISL-98]
MTHRTEQGYIIAGPDDRGCCVIHEMWVDPEHRGSGEGRALVDCVRAWAHERELAPLIVQCSPRNHGGRAFYEALGMRAVAIVHQEDLDRFPKRNSS